MLRILLVLLTALSALAQLQLAQRPRAPDIGIPSGTLPRGPLDAITDVAGATVTSNGRTVEALPIDRTVEILKRHGMVSQ